MPARPYQLPQFNTPINIYRQTSVTTGMQGSYPGGDVQVGAFIENPTDNVGIADEIGYPTEDFQLLPVGIICMPAFTDVRSYITNGGNGADWIEAPANSGILYVVMGVADREKYQPFEYRIAYVSISSYHPPPVPLP